MLAQRSAFINSISCFNALEVNALTTGKCKGTKDEERKEDLTTYYDICTYE